MACNMHDLALLIRVVDGKRCGRDLVGLRGGNVYAAKPVKERASMIQVKTGKPVRFEINETTRLSLQRWTHNPKMTGLKDLWPTRIHGSLSLSTRQ